MASLKQCPDCPSSFSTRSGRKAHMRAAEHGWACPTPSCEQGPWQNKGARDEHLKHMHQNGNGSQTKQPIKQPKKQPKKQPTNQPPKGCTHKPWNCLLCGDCALSRTMHMRAVHTVCAICNASCPSAKQHNEHYETFHPSRFCTQCDRPWAPEFVDQYPAPHCDTPPPQPVAQSFASNTTIAEVVEDVQLPVSGGSSRAGDTGSEGGQGAGPADEALLESPTIPQAEGEIGIRVHNLILTVSEAHAAELSAIREAIHRLELDLASVRETLVSTARASGETNGLPGDGGVECGEPQARTRSQSGSTGTEDMPIVGAPGVIAGHTQEALQSTSNRESSPSSCDVRPIVPSLPKGLDLESERAATPHIRSGRTTMNSNIYVHYASGDVAYTAEATVVSSTCSGMKSEGWEAVSASPQVSDMSSIVDHDDDLPGITTNTEGGVHSASPSTIILTECRTSDMDPSKRLSDDGPYVDPSVSCLGCGSCETVPPVQENDAGFVPHDLRTRTTPLSDRFSCKSCSKEPAQPTVTMCGHLFCHDCIIREMSKNLKCPACHTVMLVHLRLD